jgi:hypothetical protein
MEKQDSEIKQLQNTLGSLRQLPTAMKGLQTQLEAAKVRTWHFLKFPPPLGSADWTFLASFFLRTGFVLLISFC